MSAISFPEDTSVTWTTELSYFRNAVPWTRYVTLFAIIDSVIFPLGGALMFPIDTQAATEISIVSLPTKTSSLSLTRRVILCVHANRFLVLNSFPTPIDP